ncbi:hypothetical protein PG996_002047 [Apiospora saccharicola]|uniref:Uncharacterized protein n=1 Tax=Apiospora saccharicola TaxID=335842 RepID=A0ABR1WIC5_9PEZI
MTENQSEVPTAHLGCECTESGVLALDTTSARKSGQLLVDQGLSCATIISSVFSFFFVQYLPACAILHLTAAVTP